MNLIFYGICLVLVIQSGTNADDQREKQKGTNADLDTIVLDPYVQRAITFSVSYKDDVYKEVLAHAIDRIRKLASRYKDAEKKEDAEYYAHLLENVRKYTGKWLAEEVLQFDMQSQDDLKKKPTEMRKSQIARFVYYTASDFGVDLVMNGHDTSLAGWKSSIRSRKQEKHEL